MSKGLTRRGVLQSAAAATAGMAVARVPGAAAQETPPVTAPAPVVSRGRTKIVVLGSLGGQQITRLVGADRRCGTSVLIDVAGEVTVLDCGCGSTHRVVEAGYDLSQVRRVLITHCHFDHVSELGQTVYYSWTSGRSTRDDDRRMDVYGPTGIADYERHFARGVRISLDDQHGPLAQTPRFGTFARWHQFAPPRKSKAIYDTDEVEVHAIRVKHGDVPSVGYRIKTADVDVVFSGDRGSTGDRFAEFCMGADAVFHEIVHRDIVLDRLRAQKVAKKFIEHVVGNHTDAPGVARVANSAGVGTVVLYHLTPGNPLITDEAWQAYLKPHYDGRVIVSKDLMVV